MLKIYLSGSVKKGNTDTRSEKFFWSDQNEIDLTTHINSDVTFLNPSKTKIKRNDYLTNYGCDLYLVAISDVMIVDLREKKGIGVGAEMMFAQEKAIPVIGWSPKNTKYRRDRIENVMGEDLENWVHPFVAGLCDLIEEDLKVISERVNNLTNDLSFTKKTLTIDAAIKRFLNEYGGLEGLL